MTDETDLPPGWVACSLGDFLSERGQSIDPSAFPDEEFDLYSVPSFDTGMPEMCLGETIGSTKQPVAANTVLVCKINPRINRVWKVSNSSSHRQIASTEWITFPSHAAVDPDYLRYYMSQDKFRRFLASNVSGVGGSLMRVRPSTLARYPFTLAPINEQRRLVEKIDELFSLIEAGEQALARARRLLERYRQSVLNAAVTGELTKEWRERHQGDIESGEDLLKRILKARREAWEKAELAKMRARGKPPTDDRWKQKYREPQPPDTSTLPDLPEGWVWATLEMLTDGHEGNGISIKGSDNPPGTPALRLDSVRNGAIDFSVRRYIPLPLNRVSRYEVVPGDFLISRANGSKHLLACAALVTREPAQCVFPDTIIRFRAIDGVLLGQWLQSIWPSRLVRNQIEARGKTSAGIWKVSQEDLRRVHVPLPSPAERAFIIDAVETSEWDGVELSCELEVITRRAAALRQSILAAAFSGKLVPQDPADEPASVLLARIRAERAQPAAKPPKRPGAGHRQRKTPQLALPIEERQT